VDNASWKRLFASIRPEDQESLVLITTGSLEIAVQSFSRLEDEIVLIRGRVSGQQEGGRLFMLPYSNILSVYVNRRIIQEEIDLYSPTVSIERKHEIAKEVAAMADKAKQAAKEAEESIKGQKAVPADLARQLEELRKSAGLGIPEPVPASGEPAKQSGPTPIPAPGAVALPGAKKDDKPSAIPPRITVPKPPTRSGG
jgi:hypothetical protein